MRVFAGGYASRDAGRAEAVFLGNELMGGMPFSLNSNSERNWRLDVSLGPADVWGLRGGFVRGRPAGGGEGLVAFEAAGGDVLDWGPGESSPELCLRWGDLDSDRKELALALDLAEATCRSDWLVGTMVTSRSAISMVSGPL